MRKRRRCFILGGVVLAFCLVIYYPILLSIQPEDVEIWNRTRDLVVFVHPQNYTAAVDATQTCYDGDSNQEANVFLLVVVCSATFNFENRMAIRDTWGRSKFLNAQPRPFSTVEINEETDGRPNITVVDPLGSFRTTPKNDGLWPAINVTGDVRLIFMLGLTDNDTIQEKILEESSKFGDVIQEDFLDTYNNLTLKSVMMLKWVNATCRGVQYLMKTDDDTFVNVPRLVLHLRTNGRPNLLLGCLICGALPVKDKNSKWYAPKALFSERVYPNYLSGTGYVISGDLVPRLYAAALVTPFFHMEDIFITGICARHIRIKPVDYEGFTYLKRPLNPCLFHMAITGHKVSSDDTRNIWKDMYADGLQCNNASLIKLRTSKPSKCFK